MKTRVIGAGVRVAVVVIATGVVGYWFARGAAHVARQAYQDFVSG
jgi:hypothetical protein